MKAICFSRLAHTILSQILEELNACNESVLIPVNPLEGRMRLKFFQGCYGLTLAFDYLLTSLQGDQKFLELYDRIVVQSF